MAGSGSKAFKAARNVLLFLLVISALVYGNWWLWQRQPRPAPVKQSTTNQVQAPKPQKAGFVQVPKDSQVLPSAKVEISGKVDGEALIVIVSNSTSAISKSAKSGEFKIPIELSKGLNLLDIQVFDKNLSATDSEKISVFVAAEDEPLPQNFQVFAGSVKGILDNVITLTAQTGEKKVKTDAKTNITFPAPPLAKTSSPAPDSVRIGDFAIALGEVKDDVLSAQDLEIIRENKPQIAKIVSPSKILTAPKSGSFSAKDIKSEKIINFALDKNSRALKDEKPAKDTDIVKDLSAIIIYQEQDDKKIADLVYLLP